MKIRLLMLFFISLLSVSGVFCQESASLDEGVIPLLKFKDADIKIVLQAIAQKAVNDSKRVNIVVAPEVEGLVTVDLRDITWEAALEAVLKMYDYGYEWIGKDIIMVSTLEKITQKRELEAQAAQQEPLETVSYKLKFLDARDVKELIASQLTARGKVTILETEVQKGWKARGGFLVSTTSDSEDESGFSRAKRKGGARPRTNLMVITDTKSNVRKILATIKEIDLMPKQVLIEARIMEVAKDKLRDIGFDFATGSTGVTGTRAEAHPNSVNTRYEGSMLGNITPSVFGPKAAGVTGVTPYSAGLEFIFRKYTGSQFEAILHALAEDVNTNTLSAPRIVTLDSQEAYIMVGEARPIIKSEIEASENSVGISKSLDDYQRLGIELNVVPQICDDKYINLIIYPSVTSSSENVDATSQIGTAVTTDSYPIILVRETQTQILMKDGETIAIGGLLKDVKKEGVIKVPILGDIPLLGLLFQRKTSDTEKIDLVIFITVKILEPGEASPQDFFDISASSEFN